MGTDYKEFRQTLGGRGFILLEVTLFLSALWMIELILGCEGPFDRSQNLGPNCWNF